MEPRAPYITHSNEESMRAEALAWHARAIQLETDLSDLAQSARFNPCPEGRRLYLLWCLKLERHQAGAARLAKAAYYAHRNSCPECPDAPNPCPER